MRVLCVRLGSDNEGGERDASAEGDKKKQFDETVYIYGVERY